MANNEKEHAHKILVALEHFIEGQSDFGLDLVAVEAGPSENHCENERERDDGEDDEEEENVVGQIKHMIAGATIRARGEGDKKKIRSSGPPKFGGLVEPTNSGKPEGEFSSSFSQRDATPMGSCHVSRPQPSDQHIRIQSYG
ncbi:hypothetical protein L3X38_028044 [Prunus dulcis]|uniref:Uncharacterized protein n=1 Tax=Prunus dulcis TaxID=3755 RepID=A0AAD4VQZ7_PRUDU|nr:hypothetical protein L3X38_028044 [Prunus dulcis]